MITRTISGTIQGVDVQTVEIEVNAFDQKSRDPTEQPHFNLIGLPDAAVRESRDRVRTALGMNGVAMPTGVTTVNLAPAALRKTGGLYDLPIALCLCAYRRQLPAEVLAETMVVGELSLNGELRGIRGALALAMHAKGLGLKQMVLPLENAREAAVSGMRVYGARSLPEARDILSRLAEARPSRWMWTSSSGNPSTPGWTFGMSRGRPPPSAPSSLRRLATTMSSWWVSQAWERASSPTASPGSSRL